ncbi:hypothetical protein BDR05DRAFT_959047 [Suillus weaverae]|nr:hypothetical protein BDR05DRAFT_959047 [Suillus weaverae]
MASPARLDLLPCPERSHESSQKAFPWPTELRPTTRQSALASHSRQEPHYSPLGSSPRSGHPSMDRAPRALTRS